MKKIYTVLTLLATLATFSASAQIKINEIVAKNTKSTSPDYGLNSDWIELYNMGTTSVDIAGYYITGSSTSISTKKFPSGNPLSIIPAGGYLRIWCDDSTTRASSTQLHLTFKISSTSGDFVGVYSPTDTAVAIDSFRFGPLGADTALARCPNGTGAFVRTATLTPAASNCAKNEIETMEGNLLTLYPNPVADVLHITGATSNNIETAISNLLGQVLITSHETTIPVPQLTAGSYLVAITAAGMPTQVRKIVKQ